jgi:hypothetical protein
VSGSQRTQRFVIAPDSLEQMRAEMPSVDDEWEVEAVLQYRTYFRQEQWLIKWKGYCEDRNTWEPLAPERCSAGGCPARDSVLPSSEGSEGCSPESGLQSQECVSRRLARMLHFGA